MLFVIWIAAYFFLATFPIAHPKPFDQKRFGQIVAEIQTGKLAPNGAAVMLPPDLAGASVTGRAYLTNGYILIPTWVGQTTFVVGPCDPDDHHVNAYLYTAKPVKVGSSQFLQLNAPNPSSPSNVKKDTGHSITIS